MLRGTTLKYITGALPGHVSLLLPFSVYVLTLAPTVTFWDSGELCYAAMELGIPHHPGYPLYMHLAKAFTMFPVGNVAFRVAGLSALCASLAAYVLFRTIRALSGGFPAASWAASAFAVCFALSPLVWPQAVVAEVYGLHALLLASATYLVVRYDSTGRAAFLLAACFALGLSFANHHTTVFILPAAILFMLSDKRITSDTRTVLAGVFFMVLGASIYLYLPIRAATAPAINLGDPETLGGFRWLMRWDQYSRAILKRLSDPVGTFGPMLGGMGALKITLLAACLAITALAVYTARRRSLFAGMLLAGVSFYLGIVFLTSGDTVSGRLGLDFKFYMPVAIFGIAGLFVWLGDRWHSPGRVGTVVFLSAFALGIFVAAASLQNNYERYCNIDNHYATDFAKNTLKSVDERGVLFAWGDSGVFPAWYLQGVEKYREDVLLIYTPILNNRWYFDQVGQEVHRRYGVDRPEPYPRLVVEGNMDRVVNAIGGASSVSFDYTAMINLNRGWMEHVPVGMAWKARGELTALDSRKAWSFMVVRVDDPDEVSREMVAEDIFRIYGFQAFWWGENEVAEGEYGYARDAFYKAMFYGYEPEMVEWRLSKLEERGKH